MKAMIKVSEVCGFAWDRTKDQFWALVGLLIGYCILSTLLSMVLAPMMTSKPGEIVVNLISGAISLLFSMGYYKNCLQALDGEEPQISAYGQQARKILTYFVASVLVGLAIAIGLVLLIIPGIYLALRLQFFGLFIVEEDAGIIDSIKKSWAITEGNITKLLLIFLSQFALVILGLLLLIIGIFVTLPLVYMISCHTYRTLLAAYQSKDDYEPTIQD